MIGIARGLFKSNVKSGSGVAPFDPDAQTFITAANITDTTQQSAVNQLVLDFKSIGVWTKEKALYPILGGVDSSHAVNLKQPGTFNLSFTTSWTHTINGMIGNGVSTYSNSSLNPSLQLLLNNTHLSIYSRTSTASSTWQDIGNTVPPAQFSISAGYSNVAYSDSYNYNTGRVAQANTDARGFYVQTRTTSAIHKLFKNGLQFGATNTGASGAFVNNNIYIGALNQTSTAPYSSARQYVFASIGDGLTDTDALNKTVAVQKYQRALGRAVDMEIQVGTGATRSYYTPFSTLDNYSISGNIYLQSEVIGAAIPMLGIEMYFSGFTLPYSLVNQEIYLAHVSQSQFDSAPAVDFSDLTLSDLTLVKASFTFTAANNAWVRMNFDTPFQYNGTSNILVIWKNNRGTWSSGGGGSDTHTSTSRSMYKVGSTGQPTGNGTLTNSRSNIKFIW